MDTIFSDAPLPALGLAIFLALALAWEAGARWRQRSAGSDDGDAGHGYILSAVLGLLALLIAFTFGLALNRFETRRELVVREANAISTAEMRAHLLDAEPATRLSGLLHDYARVRLQYGEARAAQKPPLLAASADLRARIQAETLAALQPLRTTPLAPALASAVNDTLDIGVEREAAHAARLPSVVMAILVVYAAVAAAVLGYAVGVSHRQHRLESALLFVLLSLALCLVLDLDRARDGAIQVSQAPMRQLVAGFAATPPASPASPP